MVMSSDGNGSGLPGFGLGWNRPIGLSPGQEPPITPTHVTSTGLLPSPDINPWSPGWVRPGQWFLITDAATLALIMFPNSDCIMPWCIHRLSSFTSSFTSSIQICGLTNIHWVAEKYWQILREIPGFSIVTPRMLVGWQIWQREATQRLEPHNLCNDHVTIRSELRFIFGAQIVHLECGVLDGKTGPMGKVRVVVW